MPQVLSRFLLTDKKTENQRVTSLAWGSPSQVATESAFPTAQLCPDPSFHPEGVLEK